VNPEQAELILRHLGVMNIMLGFIAGTLAAIVVILLVRR
jgi:hypothetical protein